MDAQELRNLQEAYVEVVENQQQLDEGMTMKDFKQRRSRQKQKEKRAADKIAPGRRAGIHADEASPERAARHRANVDPDFDEGPDADERNYPGGKLRAKKVRKANALGELGEGVDLFDYLLEYLVAEGYADTNKAALAIMANMSEEWKQSIVEGGINFSVPSRVDDFNNRRDELKNRYKQDVGPRIPGPGGGGQYGEPSAPKATGVRLARGTSSSNRGTETKNNA